MSVRRLLFLDHTATWSGGEIALARLLESLEPSSVVTILAEEGPLVTELSAHGIDVVVAPLGGSATLSREQSSRLPLGAVVDVLRYVRRLRSQLRRWPSALVHTNSLKSGIYGCLAARSAGVPVVWHVRDRIADDYLPPRLRRLVQLLLVLLPDAILVNSATTAGTIGPAAEVLPTEVLDDPYRPPNRPDARAAPGATPVVALVGRLSPWKGQLLFLDALDLLAERRPVSGLLLGKALFGEEEYAAEVERRVVASTSAQTDVVSTSSTDLRVELSSFSGDVAEALRGVDVVVNASVIPEPFGQVVVEAIANGVPVVVPDVGGPAEIVEDGVSGLHFRSGDAQSLADQLDRLLGDPHLYERLSRNGLERAAHYDPDRIAAEFLAFAETVQRIPFRTRLRRLLRTQVARRRRASPAGASRG